MRKPLLIISTAALLLAGCTDIVEEDLDGFGVVLLTPPQDHTTSVNQIEFRWEEVPNATRYRIQVTTPDFNSPVLYLLDSAATTNFYVLPLAPGGYQWRVRAENDNSHTDWYTRSLTITSSQTLAGQTPVLVSPVNDFITDTDVVTFDWDTLPFTVDHRFELHANGQNGALLQALIVPESELTLSSLADGHYAWGVQAQNDVPSSSDFAFRQLTVDATPPSAPIQLAPAVGATIPQTPFTFLWQSGQDALTDTHDSLIVKNSLLQVVRSVGNASGTYADSLGAGAYTWTIKTRDEAGNTTAAGPIAFTVQ